MSSCYEMDGINCGTESIVEQGFITGIMEYLAETPNADYDCVTQVVMMSHYY